ncbi:uncharacterized protein Dsimw501_GD27157, isoform A [Drosophila simulans]|uniref:Uncharacterized protein, isoform A n=1 Tax=Drosophila simulans TaxID=7240 RepID=A0A0J9RY40_DROSI|nr:uncharacterized protein Dsimw501_GD27157, isoform A [Drosophila simulans]
MGQGQPVQSVVLSPSSALSACLQQVTRRGICICRAKELLTCGGRATCVQWMQQPAVSGGSAASNHHYIQVLMPLIPIQHAINLRLTIRRNAARTKAHMSIALPSARR